MPTVPVRERQVQSAPLRAQGVSSPNVPKIGGGEQVFKAAQDIFLEERRKADQVVVLDADNKLAELKTRISLEASNLKGKDAAGATDYARQEWEKGVADIEKTLSNNEQRFSFKQRNIAHWGELDGMIKKHTSVEIQRYDDDTAKSWINNTMNWAISNYNDPAIVSGSLNAMRAVLRDYARRKGLSPDDEQIKETISDIAGKTHAGVINRMIVNGQDLKALEYYKANKDALGKEVTDIEAKLSTASTDGEASRIASQIFANMGPKNDMDPVNTFQMVEYAREKYGDNQKLFKAIKAEITDMGGNWNNQQKENEEANEATVRKAVADGATLAQIRTLPEYQKLSGNKQLSVKNEIIDRANTLSEREKKPTEIQWAAYWKYSEPDKLASITENQIWNLTPELGPQLRNQLMTLKRAQGKVDLSVVSLDDKTFKDIAQSAGLKPYKSTQTEKEKAALGQLRDQINTILAAEQQSKGRPLTLEEKKGIMQREIDNKVMVDVWGTDPEKAAFTLTQKERSNAYVPFEKIPSTDRDKMNRLLISRGKTVSAGKMERLYAADRMGDRALFDSILEER